jgi:hypothetical protein
VVCYVRSIYVVNTDVRRHLPVEQGTRISNEARELQFNLYLNTSANTTCDSPGRNINNPGAMLRSPGYTSWSLGLKHLPFPFRNERPLAN